MKKTLSLVLILSMLICSSFSVFAAETTTGESPSVLTTTSESATPWIVHTYTKTVKKAYSKQSSIPESISYKEYNDSLGAWFSGTLYLKSTKKTTSGWQATFSGTLSGRI